MMRNPRATAFIFPDTNKSWSNMTCTSIKTPPLKSAMLCSRGRRQNLRPQLIFRTQMKAPCQHPKTPKISMQTYLKIPMKQHPCSWMIQTLPKSPNHAEISSLDFPSTIRTNTDEESQDAQPQTLALMKRDLLLKKTAR